MMHDQVLRVGSLVGKNKVRDAARHNLRELPPAPHIDSSLSGQNRVLHGAATADEVARQGKAMLEAGVDKIRANAIRAIELLVCLPADFNGDAMAFFTDALEWADAFYQVPVLSAVVHLRDESAPHMHVILLPIVDRRLQGAVVMGNLTRIQAMQADFYANVGRKYGLQKKPAARLSRADRRNAAMQIVDAIAANPALLKGGQVKNMLLGLIERDPEPFAASMGMTMPEPMTKASKQTFVKIMTKPQKPERKKTPIEVLPVAAPAVVPSTREISNEEKTNLYPVVDVLNSSPAPAPADTDAAGEVRERDADMLADRWDADQGAFTRLRQAPSKRAEAFAAVRAILAANRATTRNAPVRVAGHISCVSSPLQPAGP